MSGIFGIWNTDGRPCDQRVFGRLSATLAHRGGDGDGRWIDGAFALGCRLHRVSPEAAAEVQPFVDAGSRIVLVFDGRLDNRDELLNRLSECRERVGAPDGALILAAYRTFGRQFVEHLNGDFALALFDTERRHLLLARDAIGMRPLYYYRGARVFLFASEMKTILAHPDVPTRPNADTLAEYVLNRDFPDDESTFFEGICRLPPARLVRVTREGAKTTAYWDFETMHQIRLASFGEYAEGLRHYFQQAVRRRLRSAHPVAVAVSGGVDSSSVLCAAEDLRRQRTPGVPPVLGLSYVFPNDTPANEEAFLDEVERKYAVTIERIRTSRPPLQDGSEERLWHFETPYLRIGGHTLSMLLEAGRSAGARVLLSGDWADNVLCDPTYLVDLLKGLSWRELRADLRFASKRRLLLDVARLHLPHGLAQAARRVRAGFSRKTAAHEWYTGAFRRRAYPYVVRPLRTDRRFATAHARGLYERVRARGYLDRTEWFNKACAPYGMEPAFPFLDRDLLAFLMAIPGRIQTEGGIEKAILREAMRGVLPEGIRVRETKADLTDFVNDAMHDDLPRLASDLLTDGVAARMGYVKKDIAARVLRLRSRIRAPDPLLSWSLECLFGLELWLRVFVDGRSAEKEEMYAQAG